MRLAAIDSEETPPYCDSPSDPGTIGNAYCGAQAFLFTVGGMGTASWFLIVGANLFLMLTFDYRYERLILLISVVVFVLSVTRYNTNCLDRATKVHCVIVAVVATGYSLTCFIILGAGGAIGGSSGFCFSGNRWYLLGPLLIPIYVCTIVTGILLVPLVFIVVRSKAKISQASKRRQWLSTLRVLIYTIYYFMALVIATSFYLWNIVKYNEIQDGILAWLMCSVSFGSDCRDQHLYHLGYPFFVFQGSFLCFVGIVVFLCFGTSEEVLKFWKRVIHGEISALITIFTKSNQMKSSSRSGSSLSVSSRRSEK